MIVVWKAHAHHQLQAIVVRATHADGRRQMRCRDRAASDARGDAEDRADSHGVTVKSASRVWVMITAPSSASVRVRVTVSEIWHALIGGRTGGRAPARSRTPPG